MPARRAATVAFVLVFASLAAMTHGSEASTVLPELPEGEGIAGKYPGDLGIEQDAAVVFADGFEGIEDDTIATGPEQQKGKKWNYIYKWKSEVDT